MSFFLMGVVASAYGPVLAFLSHRFAVTLPVAGEVFSAHFAGALAGTLGSMWAIGRLPNRHTAAAGLGSLGLGSALVVLAPSWPVLLAAALFVGVGYGALAIEFNQMVAHSAGRARTSVLNLLNGTFGVGAVLGPILVAALGEQRFTFLYAAVAILAIALVGQASRISGRLPVAPRSRVARPKGLVLVFGLGFALYVGVEAGTGGWSTSHLVSTGLRQPSAAAITSGYWLALGAGRLLAALLPASVPEWGIVLASSALGAIALLLAVSGTAAPVAYVAAGFAIAPIFPTGIVWLAKLMPGDARATSWLFPGAMLGGALIPGGIGFVIGRVGLGAAPLALAAVATGTFLAFALARGIAKSADLASAKRP